MVAGSERGVSLHVVAKYADGKYEEREAAG